MTNYFRTLATSSILLITVAWAAHAQQPASPPHGSSHITAPSAEANPHEMESLNLASEGNYKRMHGDVSGGIARLQKALRVDRGNKDVYLDLAEAYAQQHDWQNSVKSYRVIMYDWPGKHWGSSVSNDYDHLLEFTVALQNAGLQNEAQTVYLKAMRFVPDRVRPLLYVPDDLHVFNKPKMNASIHIALAEMYAWRSHTVSKELVDSYTERSIAESRVAIVAAPRYAPGYKMLGDALVGQSVWDRAKKRTGLIDAARAKARDAYRRAASLDDGETGAAARRELQSYWLKDAPKATP